MNKKEARDILFTLVYEAEFNREKSAAEIYETALDERGFENFRYIKKGLSDIIKNRDRLAAIIEKRADSWKISRMAPVTRAILFVASYDMVYKSLACEIAINEAVELAKKYDEGSAVPFINGVLNSIAKDVEDIKANEISDSSDDKSDETTEEALFSETVEPETADIAENEK